MANQLNQVAGLSTGAQVLTGEITPPTVGVNDYAARVVPGAEAAPVGQTPAALTEVVSGRSIPKLHELTESVVKVDSAGRYGLELVRGVGYGTEVETRPYKTVFVVARVPASFRGGFFVAAGSAGFFVAANGKFVTQDLETKKNTTTTGDVVDATGVYTVAGRGSQTVSIAPDGSSGISANRVGGKSQIRYGTSKWADELAGIRLYDVICYSRELSDTEILTVRQALQATWAAVPVGGVTWKE